MAADSFLVSQDVDDETAKAIEAGLDGFNERRNGPNPKEKLWVVCRDEEANLIGGLHAHIMWDWLAIALLWVREDSRGRGIGSRLLERAERSGLERGCTRSQLATVSFQAPDFYRKRGYAEIGRLDDFPPGHAFIWLRKSLVG